MISSFSFISTKNIFYYFHLTLKYSFLFFLFTLIILSCSPAKRFPSNNGKEAESEREKNLGSANDNNSENNEFSVSDLRVSLEGVILTESLLIESPVYLFKDGTKIAHIKSGNVLKIFDDDTRIKLEINNEIFSGNIFLLSAAEDNDLIRINGKRYRGKIQISSAGSTINVINIIKLEDYVKGVLAKEMPIGKNEENLEALKALAICVRTYALQKVKNGNVYFDLYADTRDQVYGGADAENPVSNKAVEQTNNMILKFEDNPALVYYHSTCGGYTENSQNVFTKEHLPYLSGIKDGSDPYCKISPRFEWKETYSKELIIERLKAYSLLNNNNYTLKDIIILSTFDSGRINELEFKVVDTNGNEKSIVVKGNEIRNVLRTANGKSILWSNMFELIVSSDSVELIGKGFGHGVGLCQWGAISLSKMGWSYEDILDHYYPGTYQESIND